MKTSVGLRKGGIIAAVVAAILGASAGLPGCDSGSFVPPPPASAPNSAGPIVTGGAAKDPAPADRTGPRSTRGEGASRRPEGSAAIVELILARPPDTDRDYLTRALRRELGKMRIVSRVDHPSAGEPASRERLAGAIRSAAGRGIGGLIVEPLDDPAVADAIYEAVGRGVAVLLLDRSVPARDGRSIPRLEYRAIAEVGGQVAAELLQADRSLHRAKSGRAIFLHHRTDDPYVDRCLASMLDPIKAAGKPVQVIAFEEGSDRATEALRKALEADPKIDILLADDGYGMAGGQAVYVEWHRAGRPEFLFGGFAPYDARAPELMSRVHAFADRSVERYTTKAAQTIGAMLEGKKVGDVVGVPMTFYRKGNLYVPAAKAAEPER